ncbi:MAG: DUF4129 domain-containing protein [Promethearchaeota archaeon]|nr:MAG: DUF4129 domain-containing protein [Candidatus Lokiarchaeota archaeon]
MAKKKTGTGSMDLGSRLKNIQMLVGSKRIREAIAYQYMIFVLICSAKYKVQKHPSQSIRDYAMIMVKDHGLNSTTVYPFVQEVESVIYGGKPPTEDVYRRTLTVFGNVFEELVGKALPPM